MTHARWMGIGLIAMSSAACASVETTDLRVRDPALIEVERVTASGRRARDVRCGRDIDGFPLLCERGEWLVRYDGILSIQGTPVPDRESCRVPTIMRTNDRPCRRSLGHMCGTPVLIEFVTPWSNVVSVRVRRGPLR